MCARFPGCLPSTILDEDAELLRYLAIEERGQA